MYFSVSNQAKFWLVRNCGANYVARVTLIPPAPQMLCLVRCEYLASYLLLSAVRGSGLSGFSNGQVGFVSKVNLPVAVGL